MTKELNPVENEDFELKGIWSMGDHLLLSNKPAIDGEAKIVHRDHWGEVGEVSITTTNPTYMDLWMIGSKLIDESGDEHHSFIEDFYYDEDNDVWVMSCGS